MNHRWQIEENFQAGKGLTGLEEHQVRSVTAIRRHQTLVSCGSCLRWDALFHDHPTLHETAQTAAITGPRSEGGRPPPQLQALMNSVAAGSGPYLYLRIDS